MLLQPGHSGNCTRYHECYYRSQPANEDRLDRATDPWRTSKVTLDVAKTSQCDKSGDCRYSEGGVGARENDVRTERDKAACDVSSRNRSCTENRSPGIGFLKTQLKSHHEVNPGLWPLPQRIHN